MTWATQFRRRQSLSESWAIPLAGGMLAGEYERVY